MNFLSIADFSRSEISRLIKNAVEIKKNPGRYSSHLKNRTLLMFFEQPSLRTRLSFETGMTQLGGHAIYYQISESTIGKKETYKDFACVVSRYCDAISMRIDSDSDLREVSGAATVPVINMMTSLEHPCQILSDLMTIYEKFHSFKLKLAYLGDGFNNVTHSLLLGAALVGSDISIASPKGRAYEPDPSVVEKARKIAKESGIEISSDPRRAVKGADVVYTDTWMSYRIAENAKKERIRAFLPYQVNEKITALAKRNFVFMHCLPAKRGQEVTENVIDGRNSIVYDQAENRMHAQKALLLKLMK